MLRYFIALCLLVVTPVVAQESTSNKSSKKDKIKLQTIAGLSYYQSKAAIEEASIILILLHGYGSGADDLVPVGKKLFYSQEYHFLNDYISCLYPVGPIETYEGGRAWSELNGEGFMQTQSKLKAFVKSIQAMNPSAYIVVGGFSQGAIMTLNLMSKEIDAITGYALFAPANMMLTKPKGINVKPVFMTHGRKDKVLPFRESLSIKNYLKSKKYPITWVPHDEGHVIVDSTLKTFELFIMSLLQEGEIDFLKQEYAKQNPIEEVEVSEIAN